MNANTTTEIINERRLVRRLGPTHWMSLRSTIHSAEDLLPVFGVRRPPVDVVRLAKGMGVTLWRQKGMQAAGYLNMDLSKGKADITISEEDYQSGSYRWRFTLAHEIGHLMLHNIPSVHRDSPETIGRPQSLIERQANRFAAELLMPSVMFAETWINLKGDIAAVARQHEVSVRAAEIRVRELHL